MSLARFVRRSLVVAGLPLSLATCRDAFGPPSGANAQIAFIPIFPSRAELADFGLTIDAVRFVVVRPPSDTLADTTVALPPGATELAVDLRVPILRNPENLSVSIVALSGGMPLFRGSRVVPVPTPRPPPEIPLDSYVGPVVDSLVILPGDPFILVNDSLRFQIAGFNGGVPVPQFYVAWSTSDSTLARINHFGVLRAPALRSSLRVRARTPNGAADSVVATFTPPATLLFSIAGGGQTDTVGSALGLPLEVEARAADGLGVGGVAVRFRAVAGGGAVADTLVVTDAAGRARTTATLGPLVGAQSFEAGAQGLAGSPLAFTATALAGVPAQLTASAGDAQLAVVGSAVTVSPAVLIRDAGGNPVAGVPVTFSVTAGAGGVTGASQTTGSNGVATVGTWTLGPNTGLNTLRADAGALSRSFSATGIAGAPARLVVTAGNSQSAVVGGVVAVDPAVRVEDQFGNPVAGATVTFAVSGGGGGVTGAAQLTNAAGVATLGSWTLGTAAGLNTLTASLGAITPVSFTATGLAGAAATIVKLAGDSQSAVVNTLLATAPQVRVTDQHGNPVAGVVVAAAVGGGGLVVNPSPVTDSAGVASVGGWQLGTLVGQNALTMSASGLSGSPVSFVATGLVDVPSQMTAFAGDGQSAIAGSPVSINPAVRVSDLYGNPVAGVAVTFAVVSGGGTIQAPTTVFTDTAGIATSATWTLGTVGPNTLDATSLGLPSVTFSADALASLASTIDSAAGGGDSAIVGTILATAFAVVVRDAGSPVAGVPVNWSVGVGGGGGSITPALDTTDALGIASAVRTLGTTAGTQSAMASVGGLMGSPVIFTATALPDAPAQLIKQSLDQQTGIVATAVTAPIVKVADQFGNAIAGVVVDFAVSSGGTVGSAQATSDALGRASCGSWSLASLVGTNTVVATAGALPAVTFTATGEAGPPARLALVASPSRAIAADTIEPIEVVIQDQYGNRNFTAQGLVQLGFGALGNPAAKLVGTQAVDAAGGSALFTELSIDSAGPAYTLVATSGSLAAAETQPFDVAGVIDAVTGDRLGPVAAAVDKITGLVFVPGHDNTVGWLGVFDPSKRQLTQAPLPQEAVPFGIAVDADLNRLYLTTQLGVVLVIDTRNPTSVVGTIPIGRAAAGVAVDEITHRIFVAVDGDPGKGEPPALAILDPQELRLVASIPFNQGAENGVGVAFNPDDQLVYVAIPNLGVGVFDPSRGEHVTTIPIIAQEGAAGTYGVAVDGRTRLVYATNRADSSFSVIDPAGQKELDRVRVGQLPEGLGVDADRGLVFVANSGSSTVSFLALDSKTSRFTVFATLVVGPTPKAAAVDPGSGRVYVPTFDDDRVRVVQP